MIPKTSLKIKFSLFLIIFTVILLTTVLLYLYLTSRNSIKKTATRDVELYTQIFSDNFKNVVSNSVHELSGLQSQINRDLIQPNEWSNLDAMSQNPIEHFVIGYSPKYSEIFFYYSFWEKILKVVPVKIFGGEVRNHYEWINRETFRFSSSTADSLSKEIWGPDMESGERFTYISVSEDSTEKINIVASIALDYLIEQTLNNFNFPPEMEVIITDTTGIILYSSQKENINQYIQRTHPKVGESINLHSFPETENDSKTKKIAWHWHDLQTPTVFIILSNNYSPEFQQLNATFLRMILYAAFILALVLIVVWILAQKMTDTFSQITTVADKVADGDYSRKIAINRQDELGTLVDAFNDMVDKINASYRSLNQVNIELQDKISELTKTRAELSQKQRLALIGETISKISHEIQNKIGGVSIWVQNLEMQLKEDASVQIYIDEMKSALNSFMAMLTNFKRFYREPQLQKTRFSINEIIENIESNFWKEIEERKILVIKSFPSENIIVRADKDQIEEAIINVFINALYYSPAESKIDIQVEQTDLDVKISICDEGPGISIESSEKLLQPFFTTKSSGSGLGLAIVDNIIQAHRGTFSFFNREVKGACFTIQFPLDKE
jgi:signal transduction histidine kinase